MIEQNLIIRQNLLNLISALICTLIWAPVNVKAQSQQEIEYDTNIGVGLTLINKDSAGSESIQLFFDADKLFELAYGNPNSLGFEPYSANLVQVADAPMIFSTKTIERLRLTGTGQMIYSADGSNFRIDDGDILFLNNLKVSSINSSDEGDLSFQTIGNPGVTMKLARDGNIKLNHKDTAESVLVPTAKWKANGQGAPQDFSDNGLQGNFLLATAENLIDGSGISGNGETLTLWSPGDAHGGVTAFLQILDEDRMDSDDINPYDNNARILYLNDSGVWTLSDRNRKTNIRPIYKSLSKVLKMKSYAYNYKITESEKLKDQESLAAVGLMAQDLENIIPQAVNKTTDGAYFVNYSMITPLLVEAIKEQQEMIKKQSELIERLISRLDRLESEN